MVDENHCSNVPARLPLEKGAFEAFNLRKAGAGYDTIASELGLADAGEAAQLVKAVMDSSPMESLDDMRRLEASRLDEMYSAVAEGILAGNLESIAAGLRIQERRARLLGLDRKGGQGEGIRTIEARATVVLDADDVEEDLNVEQLLAEGDSALVEIASGKPG